jgi:O-antigen ligase
MLISRAYFPAKNWGGHLTTYFVDPLTFCSYALLFSLLSIIGLIYFNKKMSKFNILFSLITIVVGLYLSISSGARTGWLGLPLILIIFWHTLKTEFNIKKANALMLILMMIIGVLIYYNSNFHNKLFLALQQFSSYKLNELNIDTSVGMRLSFYRMGIQYFIERPWYGWGDLSWMYSINRAEFIQYSSEFARESPKHGFHNEIITSSVRSGIWGLMSSVCLFAGVTYMAIRGMCMKISMEHSAISFALLIVIVHLFFTGLTTEITNLTFLSAFIGSIVSVLLGEKILLEENNNIEKI